MRPEAPVLVVDDDYSYLSVVTHVLERSGLAFYVEHTGLGALRSSTERVFFVVLLDLRLPDVDGLKVLAQLSARSGDANVILISGAGSIRSAVQAMKLGAADFLEKPVDMVELIDTIASACAGRMPPGRSAPACRSSASTEVAAMVSKITGSPADVKTCDDWARLVGVSRAVLCARCERLGIRAKQALDLGRLLRVATHYPTGRADLDSLLGSRDPQALLVASDLIQELRRHDL